MATVKTIADIHAVVTKLDTIFGSNVSTIRHKLLELNTDDATKLAFSIGGVIRAEKALWESVKDREIE